MTKPKRKAKFEVFQRKGRQKWGWRLRAANGRIILPPEGHGREADALRAIETVIRTVGQIVADRLYEHCQEELPAGLSAKISGLDEVTPKDAMFFAGHLDGEDLIGPAVPARPAFQWSRAAVKGGVLIVQHAHSKEGPWTS